MDDKKSRTEKESWFEEAIFGDSHHKTTISDGEKHAEGRGRTSEEAEKNASDKWNKGETSSNSGCLITTACVTIQGLPDTCEELNYFRRFRDEYVSKLTNGKLLINEYYEKAPLIVSAINQTKTAQNTYKSLFKKLVTRTVLLIKNNEKRKALDNCIAIYRKLEKTYL